MRREGISTEVDLAGRSMKAQMRDANRMRACFALFIGEDEVVSGSYALKNLVTADQTAQSIETIIEMLNQYSGAEQGS